MVCLQRYRYYAALIVLGTGTGVYAQVSSINSATITPRVFNDIPGASFSGANLYQPPTSSSISLSEANVSAATGFADRDVWQFSNNGATSAYQFQNNDYFHVSLDLTLTGSPITPRKEAGFLFSTASSGDIQFIVNTDGHEVVQFGGIGSYSFSVSNGMSYTSGTTITIGMTYFQDSNGRNALMFSANGVNSPVQEFAAGAGIGNGSTLGGYFQIQNDPANPSNSGSAAFANISISPVIVPEPSATALIGAGMVFLLWRYRRR